MKKIRYKHDCKKCIYLGDYLEYDLYFCEKEPTVIARYGNEGEEYISGLPFAKISESIPLYIAKELAIKKKLLKI
jgi:hypothetical protein